ncbi:Acyl transferase/acyl hydrolase/lysophospholipase [Rhypophila sp. PSN 637]
MENAFPSPAQSRTTMSHLSLLDVENKLLADDLSIRGDEKPPSYNTTRNLKLLSLDGGGVRGLSSLYILQELMIAVADDPQHPPKPCFWFDMIGGTSTGGLIAIMLGRLQMSVKDCIEAYTRMMGGVFVKSRPIFNLPFTSSGKIRPRFDTKELESAIKAIIEDTGHGGETLRDPNCKCKVFVCATEYETTKIHLFSTYQRRGAGFEDVYEEALIWEACRATSAATSFFDVAEVGRSRMVFLDGATGANNPIFYLWEEARAQFGDDFERRLQLAVSVGTGRPDIRAFGNDLKELAKTMIKMSTNTENMNQMFERAHMDLFRDDRFFRFNVQVGLGSVGLEEVSRQSLIRAATHDYLELNEVRRRVDVFKQRGNYRAPIDEPSIPQPLPLASPASGQSRDPNHTAFLHLDTSTRCVNRNPRLKTSYWARITRESYALYERCFKDMAGDIDPHSVIIFEQFHYYLAQFSPTHPSLTPQLIHQIWCRLRVPGNPNVPLALPKPLAMAAICMAHMESIVDGRIVPTLEQVREYRPAVTNGYNYPSQVEPPAAPRLSDNRLKYLRLFDKWVDCSCGCGRLWNFVPDPPDALRDDRRLRQESRCLAVDPSQKGSDDASSLSSGKSGSVKSSKGGLWKSILGKGKDKGTPESHRLSEHQQNNLRAWFALDPVEGYEQREQIGGYY